MTDEKSPAETATRYAFLDPQMEQIAVLREQLAAIAAEHALALRQQKDDLTREYNDGLARAHRPPWSHRASLAAMRVMAVVLHAAWFGGAIIAAVVTPYLVVVRRLEPDDSYFIILGMAMVIVQYFVLRMELETK